MTLADDVAAAVKQFRRERGTGVSEAVNALVRRGLVAAPGQSGFVQATSEMGVATLPLDDVAGLLDVLEGDSRRS